MGMCLADFTVCPLLSAEGLSFLKLSERGDQGRIPGGDSGWMVAGGRGWSWAVFSALDHDLAGDP